ncbi:hypothetical protein [uncultured Jannaschia sp.]|uniref:hypothetical protein n=1 Tax=uncultured Jannaschia sp. TaxID=293347 RepID=UPI0026109183|nr:hypothetical protein [uncultured Jannaschia sp.]
MVHVSLALNVIVLVPVIWGLLAGSTGSDMAFGGDAPARRILISVYLAILVASAVLLIAPAPWRAAVVPGLLVVQVAYKLITVPMLGIGHPVVAANLGIAAVHGVTLWTLWRS